MFNQMKINVIGGGLAGSEVCLYLANKGYEVHLYDIKGEQFTPAHHNPNYAEIVCSNSLKSEDPFSASGILKKELLSLGCNLLKVAYNVRVPSGGALAVDREKFAEQVTDLIKNNKNIVLHTEDVDTIEQDAITIIATGPLTTNKMCNTLSKLVGNDFLYFFDAAAPIISADSINMDIAFMQGRYNKGGADYLNCPMNKEQYLKFYNELINAETATLKDFENKKVFESCMPIEVMAKRGEDSIRFGPLKPVGLVDDRTGLKSYAVVQLRKENVSADMYNMVGFQTNLTFPEQKRVFRLIPGLENAEFMRFGVMHRNNFINFPKVCDIYSRLINNNNVFIAGQLSGVEGYVESIASGLYCAINVDNMLQNRPLVKFTNNTIIGGLYEYLINASIDNFQPINANLGILAPIDIRDKAKRNELFAERSNNEIQKTIQ